MAKAWTKKALTKKTATRTSRIIARFSAKALWIVFPVGFCGFIFFTDVSSSAA
jgi:hypothetical protein